jgi:tRNA-2-methylthio-N6-dimethylallyladenosine synthase
MQGCDNFCTYCIVPYVRGREVSRRAADVLAEIDRLVVQGAREVTLLGQNVNSYGLNTPEEPDFAGLLAMVAALPGIERIRFMTSHPKDISPALIDCFASTAKLCSHIHLPAQSGCDRLLARMNRGYTRAEYLAKVHALKAARPDIQITGDMIVGFPGETEHDFEQTLSLTAAVRYHSMFSFKYSPRPNTLADQRLHDDVSDDEKTRRIVALQALQRDIQLELNAALVGRVEDVLVDSASRRRATELSGRTSGNVVVNLPGAASWMGRTLPVRIERAGPHSVWGRAIGADELDTAIPEA